MILPRALDEQFLRDTGVTMTEYSVLGWYLTRDTGSRIHTFQACAFSRSATPPTRAARKQPRRGDSTGQGAGASSACSRGQCEAVANTASGLAFEGAADEHTERRGHRVFPHGLSNGWRFRFGRLERPSRRAFVAPQGEGVTDEACGEHAKRQAKESAIGAADREHAQAVAGALTRVGLRTGRCGRPSRVRARG